MAEAMKKAERELNIKLCQIVIEHIGSDEHEQTVRELIAQGADIDFRDANRDGNTPLQLAIAKCDAKWVEILLKFNPIVKTCDGETTQDQANEITKMLIAVENTNDFRSGGLQDLMELQNVASSENSSTFLTTKQRTHLDTRGYNLLMIAIESNNIEAFKWLLKFGIDVNHTAKDGKTASDLAWELRHFNCLAELIDADSRFPKGLNNSSNYNDELKLLINDRESFHDAIKIGSLKLIKRFLSENSKLKIGYDKVNKSALTTALESKQFAVYSWLRSEGFSPDEACEDILDSLSRDEKLQIKIANREYFASSDDSFLFYLLSKCRLGFNVSTNDRKTCFAIIRRMFNELNEIPGIRVIMQVIEHSDQLEIFFDFNKANVMDLDPTSTESTSGVTYSQSGHIYVAAADHAEKFAHIIGVLAHELSHYAMQLTYENVCRPFKANDEINKKKFAKITDELRKFSINNVDETNFIISSVFDYYPENRWHSELIVRVPHLLASYKDDEESLNAIIASYCQDLFAYYLKIVVLDVANARDLVKPRKVIQQINETVGVLTTAWNSGVRVVEEKYQRNEIFKVASEKFKVISSNASMLVLIAMFQDLFAHQDVNIELLNIFIRSESLVNSDFSQKIEKAFKSKVKPKLIVDYTNDSRLDIQKFTKIFNDPKRVFLIATQEQQPSNFPVSEFHQIDFNFFWSDLSEPTKSKLLAKNIIFQGCSLKLEQLLTHDSDACNYLPLQSLLTGKLMTISENPRKNIFSQSFYIERNFVAQRFDESQDDEDDDDEKSFRTRGKNFLRNIFGLQRRKERKVSSALMNFDELSENAEERKVLIISDVAGTGKSTTLFHIAERLKAKFPRRWVALVDLKQHIDAFSAIVKLSHSPCNFCDFLLRYIVKPEKTFDDKLFVQLYCEGKCVFLFDAFDEISPHFKELMLSMVKSFDVKLGNQLWLTTRTHLQHNLENALGQLSFGIAPLTEENQVELLVQLWTSECSESEGKVENIAQELIRKLSAKLSKDKSDFVGLPLQVRMIAEFYNADSISVENLNFYTIYKSFVQKLIAIWMDKGELSKIEQSEIHMQSSGVLSVHHQIALKYLFGIEFYIDYDELEWSKEKVARVGIIHFEASTGNVRFIHETFAEYFVAEFVIANLITMRDVTAKCLPELLFCLTTAKQHEMIRVFLDRALENFKVVDTKFVELFKRKLRQTQVHDLLHNAVAEGLVSLVDFLLAMCDDRQKKLSFEHGSKEGENVLTLAIASGNSPMFEKFWELVIQNNSASKVKKMLSEYFLLRFAVIHCKNELLIESVVKKISQFVSNNELKQLLRDKVGGYKRNLLSLTARNNGNEKSLKVLWTLMETVFTSDELKCILQELDKNGRNVLHLAVWKNNRNVVETICDIIKEQLDKQDAKALFESCNNFGSNIFLTAAFNFENDGVLQTLWTCTNEILSKHEQTNMLLQQNKYSHNVINSMFKKSNKKLIQDFKMILEQNFTPEERQKLARNNSSFHATITLLQKDNIAAPYQ